MCHFLHYFNSMLSPAPTSLSHIINLLLYVTEQLMVDIERLTSDRADLLSRLQHCEVDLVSANECEYSLCSYFV